MWVETDLPRRWPNPLPISFALLILLAGSCPAFAQETPSVKAAVDKNQILIGEPIRFSIDVKSPMVSGNQLPQFDSIPHFELIEKANRDSVISATGASYHLEWKLTSFDSGTQNDSFFSQSPSETRLSKQIHSPWKFPMVKWIRHRITMISKALLILKIRV